MPKETDRACIATAEAIDDTIIGNSRYSTYEQPDLNSWHKDPLPSQKQSIKHSGMLLSSCYLFLSKFKFSAESRNDMSEQQWTERSAQLKAAETPLKLFEEQTKQIKPNANGEEKSVSGNADLILLCILYISMKKTRPMACLIQQHPTV